MLVLKPVLLEHFCNWDIKTAQSSYSGQPPTVQQIQTFRTPIVRFLFFKWKHIHLLSSLLCLVLLPLCACPSVGLDSLLTGAAWACSVCQPAAVPLSFSVQQTLVCGALLSPPTSQYVPSPLHRPVPMFTVGCLYCIWAHPLFKLFMLLIGKE